MGKQIFKGLVITVSGEFGKGKSCEDIKRWVTHAGGRYSATVTRETTHLVCSEHDWKTHTPFVEAATNIGWISIVSFDWMEDSLFKNVRLKETNYLMEVLHAKKGRRAAKEKTRGRLADTFSKAGSSKPSELARTRASMSKNAATRAAKTSPAKVAKAVTKATSATGKRAAKAAKKQSDDDSMSSNAPLGPLDIFWAHQRELKAKAYADKPRVEPYTLFGPTSNGQSSSTPDASHDTSNGDTTMSDELESEVVIYSPLKTPNEDFTETLTRDGKDKEKTISYETSKPIRPPLKAPQPKTPAPKKKRVEEWNPVDPEHYHLFKESVALTPAPFDPLSPAAPGPSSSDPGPSSSSTANTTEITETTESKVFEYNIALVRIDIRNNTNERFNLRLYESHKPLHEYVAFLRFNAPSKEPVTKALAAEGSSFEEAMKAFEQVFYRFTRKEWADRDTATKAVAVEVRAGGAEESVEEEGDTAGLPTMQDVMAKPFSYVKPNRLLRAHGLGMGPNAVVMRFGMGRYTF